MRFIFYVLIIVTIAGCDTEVEKKTTQLFTLKVDTSYHTATSDNWIVIHNETGEAIEYMPFESGEELTIKTNKIVSGNTIGITLIKYSEGTLPKYRVTTFFGYSIGGKFIVEGTLTSLKVTGNVIGTFNVTLNHTSSLDSYMLTNKLGDLNFGSETSNGSQFTYNFSSPLKGIAPNYILTASDDSGDLKYKRFDNVQPNATYNVAFSELSPFDRYCEFKFPALDNVFLMVQGRESDQSIGDIGYQLLLHTSTDTHTSIKAGYLNSLTNYITAFDGTLCIPQQGRNS